MSKSYKHIIRKLILVATTVGKAETTDIQLLGISKTAVKNLRYINKTKYTFISQNRWNQSCKTVASNRYVLYVYHAVGGAGAAGVSQRAVVATADRLLRGLDCLYF